jgi:hypothetical protein
VANDQKERSIAISCNLIESPKALDVGKGGENQNFCSGKKFFVKRSGIKAEGRKSFYEKRRKLLFYYLDSISCGLCKKPNLYL